MKRKKENKKEHKKKKLHKKKQGYIATLEKKNHFHKFFCNSVWKHSSTGLSTFWKFQGKYLQDFFYFFLHAPSSLPQLKTRKGFIALIIFFYRFPSNVIFAVAEGLEIAAWLEKTFWNFFFRCYLGYLTWVAQKHTDSCLWGAGRWCHQPVPRRKAGLTRSLCCLNGVWSQVDPGLSHVENSRSDPRLWYERGRILSPFRYRSGTTTASVRPHAHYRNMAPIGEVHTVDFSARNPCVFHPGKTHEIHAEISDMWINSTRFLCRSCGFLCVENASIPHQNLRAFHSEICHVNSPINFYKAL